MWVSSRGTVKRSQQSRLPEGSFGTRRNPLPTNRQERGLLTVLTGNFGFWSQTGQGKLKDLPSAVLQKIAHITRLPYSTRMGFRRDAASYEQEASDLRNMYTSPLVNLQETWDNTLGNLPTLKQWMTGRPNWKRNRIDYGYEQSTAMVNNYVSFHRIRFTILRFVRKLQARVQARRPKVNWVLIDSWTVD